MPSRRDPDPRLRRYARDMRHQPTDAEKKLWALLRDRGLGGFKFRRQVPVEGYILDFFCEQASTAVELDGEQHAKPQAMEYDQRRSQKLAELRIRVLRFSDRDVLKGYFGGGSDDSAHSYHRRVKTLTLALSHTQPRRCSIHAAARVREREQDAKPRHCAIRLGARVREETGTPFLPLPRARITAFCAAPLPARGRGRG